MAENETTIVKEICDFLPASRISCSVMAINDAGESPIVHALGYTQLQRE